MGNRTSTSANRSVITRRLSSGQKEKSTKCGGETFFIEHHRTKQSISERATTPTSSVSASSFSSPDTGASYDVCKRIVFVSLTGLYQSWRDCPTFVLYSSIFIFPLKKEWIYSSRRKQRAQRHHFSLVLQDAEFVRLLRWKDSQGLLFCMKDVKAIVRPPSADVLVHAFWSHLSSKLSTIYDPAIGDTYKPLRMDLRWWHAQVAAANNGSPFDVSVAEIERELLCLEMKFKSISELLYQSNPSMQIVVKFGLNAASLSSQLMVQDGDSNVELHEYALDNTFGDVMWISNDYDLEEEEEEEEH